MSARASLFTDLACLACLTLAACEDRPAHVWGAARYDAVRDCLEDAVAVDVLDGEDPGTCSGARCWQSPSGENYVTEHACDAPPDYADRSGDPPGSPCFMALDALARKASCDSQP